MSDDGLLIREIRREELDEAVAFAGERGYSVEPTKVRPRQSLLARDEAGELRGAVLCVGSAEQDVALEVVVTGQAQPAPGEASQTAADSGESGDAPDAPPPDAPSPDAPPDAPEESIQLARRLLDKALGKMRCSHLHRCSIRLHGPGATENLWRAARWSEDLARPAVRDAYSGAGSTGATGTASRPAASSAGTSSAA